MKSIKKENKVGNNIVAENANWSFSGNVVDTFDEHVSTSVPMYKEGHWLIRNLSDFFLKKDSICYDVGCSTGAVFSEILKSSHGKQAKLIGIDPVADMVQKAKQKHNSYKNISYITKDILSTDLKPCDMVVSYYTIQFIEPRIRQNIIDKIFESLNWGGAFLMFEKVRSPDARFQDINTALYSEFKLENGYTPEEIFSKTRSLKGILEPFSTQGNIDMLKRSGFKDITTILKFGPFEGYLTIK